MSLSSLTTRRQRSGQVKPYPMTPELQQYYYFHITTSATSPLDSTQLWTVIGGAAPPSGVYGMTVTVTPCRTQNTEIDCNATLSQIMTTPCGGLLITFSYNYEINKNHARLK
jgi:hypothetical protein